MAELAESSSSAWAAVAKGVSRKNAIVIRVNQFIDQASSESDLFCHRNLGKA